MSINWEQLGKNKELSYSSIVAQQQSILQTFRNEKARNKANDLEKYYNNLLYSKKGSQNYQKVETIFSSVIDEADAAFDRKTLGLKAPAKLKETSNTKLDTIAINIERAIKQLQIFNSLGLAQNYEKDLNILNTLKNQVETATEGTINLKTDLNFIENYNNYVVKTLSHNYRARTGYAFEKLITKLHNQVDIYSNNILNKTIAENIGSGEFGTKAFIDVEGLDQASLEVLKKDGYQLDDKGSKVEFMSPTADKTDIKITINNMDSYFLSLKNYLFPNTNVGISSPTRLVALLSSTKVYSDFSTVFMETTWFGGNSSDDKSEVENVMNTAKLTLTALMLTGAGFQKTTADIFVVNSRSQRHIYCYAMGDIIENLDKHPGNITIEGLPQIKQFIGLNRADFMRNFVSIKVSGSLQNLLSMMGSVT